MAAYGAVAPMRFGDMWDPWNSLGLSGSGPRNASNAIPGIERAAGPGMFDTLSKPWSPDSPLFWVGVLLAAAVGLVGFATELRAGPVRAGVKVGE
jgi:hypothetical protein